MKIAIQLFQQIHSKLSIGNHILIRNQNYIPDKNTNLTHKIVSLIDRDLINQKYHPLSLIKERIRNYFYKSFLNHRNNPIFSIHDNINPIVSPYQNFDEILIAKDHPSRKYSESYYLNSEYLLRTHTSAHQISLIRAGLNNFLIAGDVYRRDAIDCTHYPVFHQMEGVRLFTHDELFAKISDDALKLFHKGERNEICQENHTMETSKLLEFSLKKTLEGLVKSLFGPGIEMKWVNTYFPFTHPSWELEILFEGKFLEVLGCGIMEQKLLEKAGAYNRVGWAFGLGLERLAMLLYDISDIRLFWSTDTGFLNQFKIDDPDKIIKMKTISKCPQCVNNLSYWLPQSSSQFDPNDFYDLVRSVSSVSQSAIIEQGISAAGETDDGNNDEGTVDLVEQVNLVDTFKHPTSGRVSHCYEIVYRHPTKTLTKEFVNIIHRRIQDAAVAELGVTIR